MISRRDFLRLCGVTLAGAAMPSLRVEGGARRAIFAGRALEPTRVYAAPRFDADVRRAVHPDQVLPLVVSFPEALSFREATAGWFKVPGAGGGYVPARAVQPMMPYTRPAVIAPVEAPFWAEVIAPVTVARAWPLPDAPARGRPGYGATLRVIDAQADDEGRVWYRDAESGGWVQALHVRRLDPAEVQPINPGAPDKRLVIGAARAGAPRRLVAFEGDQPVMEAPVCATARASGDDRVVSAKHPGRQLAAWWGAPWLVEAGETTICGAYWHNDFGASRDGDRAAITLAPAAARWVYRWAEVGATRVCVR